MEALMLDLGNSVEHEGWSKWIVEEISYLLNLCWHSEWKRKIPSKYKRTKNLAIS